MDADLVVSSLVSTVVQKTIDNMASRFVDIFRGRKLNKMLLSKLKVKMLSIDALANDAEQKQFRDPLVRDWLLKAKDVVFDAEDLLDEIEYKLNKCKVEAKSQNTAIKVRNLLFKPFSVSSFEKEIESRMEQVLDSLEYLACQEGCLGLKKASSVGVGLGSGSRMSKKLPSTSLVVDSVIYGRDSDKEIIFNWLTSDTDTDTDNHDQPSILSIVGMGGVGKTTLAQHVYNDPRIEDVFDIKAWVCISDEFDVFNVARTILDELTKSNDGSRGPEIVYQRLKEKLIGKRFLLVLDDVWNRKQKELKDFLIPLKFGAKGSKIVVTTRDMKVAAAMGSNKTHSLWQLEGDHCWKLFAKHAFQDDNPQPNPDCMEIGVKIVEKCKGLPLALTTIGCLLHKKSSVSEWESILQSEIWEFSEEDSDIVPVLALSYHHLPSHVKRCFAYCALFPKDYEFDKECLIQLWMAENFLQHPLQSKSPEAVGEEYFDDLLSRSFFQQSSNGVRTFFVMHDLLNDLARYVCRGISFRWGVDKAKWIADMTRHFSFAIKKTEHLGFERLYDAKKLRTFVPMLAGWKPDDSCRGWDCDMKMDELFSKFKFLRVLSLSHCSGLTNVPDSVGNLNHLRSLDLSNTKIKKLPESTCLLYNLQILKLNNCENLKELPSNLHKLSNLCRLELIDTEVTKVPPHLGKLENLRVLMSSFDVGKSREFGIQQLGELNLHGRLSIRGLQNIEIPKDAFEVDLKNKTQLVELELKWDRNLKPDDSMKERDVTIIDNLQPSKYLKKLSIMNYGGKQFPRWLIDNSLSNVVSLGLDNCESCHCLPPLGLLPFLKDLEISRLNGIVGIDADFYGSSSSSFKSLETLKFSSLHKWEKWDCQTVTGAFPRLQSLSINDCPMLKVFRISDGCDSAATFPLDFFPTLKSLDLSSCSNLQMISQGHAHNHVEDLRISKCSELKSLPECMHILLPSLVYLVIDYCPKLELSPDRGLPSNLKGMNLSGCSKLIASMKGALGDHPSLETLGFENLDVESFPDEGLMPRSLVSLEISNCPFLTNLDFKGLCHLSSLKQLCLRKCPKLQGLPEEGLPKSITDLIISDNCPLLRQRYRQPGGKHWEKIAHIKNLNFSFNFKFT